MSDVSFDENGQGNTSTARRNTDRKISATVGFIMKMGVSSERAANMILLGIAVIATLAGIALYYSSTHPTPQHKIIDTDTLLRNWPSVQEQ